MSIFIAGIILVSLIWIGAAWSKRHPQPAPAPPCMPSRQPITRTHYTTTMQIEIPINVTIIGPYNVLEVIDSQSLPDHSLLNATRVCSQSCSMIALPTAIQDKNCIENQAAALEVIPSS